MLQNVKFSSWKLKVATAAAVVGAVIAGSVVASGGAHAATLPPASPGFTLGWYAANSASFDAAVVNALPVKPRIVNYYAGWDQGFNTGFAKAAYADHVETFVEMEPWNCGNCGRASTPAMTAIAAGKYDSNLTSFGKQVRAFGHPVMVTFAHEMNAPWYPWGKGGSEHTTPAQWIAAWDHVVKVVNAAAPGLVTWIWVPNVETGASAVTPYWPGAKYVNAVGLDGYLGAGNITFKMMYAQTLTHIKTVTSLPVWIAETGLNQDATTGPRLAAYIAAAHAAGITGMLYFNQGAYALTPSQKRNMATAIANIRPAVKAPAKHHKTAPAKHHKAPVKKIHR
jgi:hypothetical protein